MKENISHAVVQFHWVPNTGDMTLIWRADLSILYKSLKTEIYKYSNTYL